MNAGNRILAMSEELERAEQCLAESRMLRSGDFPYGAVSRAYYVKTGRLAPELCRLISRMQRDREDADYETDAVFTDGIADQALSDAERFLAAVRALLA